MKLLSSILILGIILGLAVSLALAFTTPSEARGKSTSQTIEVTVGLGDTVWDLAGAKIIITGKIHEKCIRVISQKTETVLRKPPKH
ncbi:MAG: hypothetical protein R6U92_07135 [Bacillota bacterium]